MRVPPINELEAEMRENANVLQHAIDHWKNSSEAKVELIWLHHDDPHQADDEGDDEGFGKPLPHLSWGIIKWDDFSFPFTITNSYVLGCPEEDTLSIHLSYYLEDEKDCCIPKFIDVSGARQVFNLIERLDPCQKLHFASVQDSLGRLALEGVSVELPVKALPGFDIEELLESLQYLYEFLATPWETWDDLWNDEWARSERERIEKWLGKI